MVDTARRSSESPYTLLRGSPIAAANELCFEGRPTGTRLSGQWLQAQYLTAIGGLLFIVDDALQEDCLEIYLVDERNQILDHARLQRMYSAGELRDLRRVGDSLFEFSFFGNDRWQLRLQSPPRLALHLPLPMREYHRDSVFAKRWLTLSRLRYTSR